MPDGRTPRNVFEGSPLHRAPRRREDPEDLRGILSAEDTVVVPVRRRQSLVSEARRPSALLPTVGDLPRDELDEETWAFLGVHGERPYVALDVTDWSESELASLSKGAVWTDLHGTGSLLDHEEASILAHARGMITWHRRHRYCGRCGSPTRKTNGGNVRECGECEILHFPRTDPAIIVLVREDDACLLGRQEEWPAGLHSTFAGFVEPGESLDEAARREVSEESGVSLDSVQYHSSQPWPFPSSIMVGFTASSGGRPDPRPGRELESVRWFERQELLAAHEAGDVLLPPDVSIARRMIDEWLRRGG